MKVGIVAASRTAYGELPRWRPHELTYLAVEEALAKIGLPFRDGYQDIVTCSSDHWEGMTLTDIRHGEVAGGHLGPGEEKVCDDGANAVLLGCVKILSGQADTVLVTACCKETEVLDPSVIENFAFDVPFQQLLGLDFTQAAALQAVQYMDRTGLLPEDLARAVIEARRKGKDNADVFCREEVSEEEVRDSPMLAHPITTLQRRPFCDGAVALVLASEDKALSLSPQPVWVTGLGSCCEAHNLGDRDLSSPEALRAAAARAYGMAGIRDPAAEIDLAEISDHYAHQFYLWCEGLGLCEDGSAARRLQAGDFDRQGPLPVNPSGGLLCGVPRYVAGANAVMEAFEQLRGEAAGRSVGKPPRIAVAHGTSGPAGQHHCVIVLERGF
ncbi:MAG: thiolase family protein [Deltaproteobacteria bacterium]|nr:thiolase family protein [Deltaproteobacteria bacterium]